MATQGAKYQVQAAMLRNAKGTTKGPRRPNAVETDRDSRWSTNQSYRIQGLRVSDQKRIKFGSVHGAVPNYGRSAALLREQIVQVLSKTPGMSFRALRRAVGSTVPRLRGCLDELKTEGRVREAQLKGRCRFFVGDARAQLDEAYGVLSTPELRTLLELILSESDPITELPPNRYDDEPRGLPGAEIVRLAQHRQGAAVSTTRNRLRRLTAAGLVMNDGHPLWRWHWPTRLAASLIPNVRRR